MTENDGRKNLTVKHRLALAALVSGKTREEAALAANVSLRTVERYLASPVFSAALDEATRETIIVSARGLVTMMDLATNTMRDIIKDENESSSVRLRACRHVVDLGPRLIEFHDLAEQMKQLQIKFIELERRINESI